MNIAISGAGGFIGEHLFSYFTGLGHTVYAIPRILPDAQPKEIAVTLSGMDVIINLAGASIIGRWNKLYKKQILDSRILTTSMLVEAIKLMDKKPELFISASAVPQKRAHPRAAKKTLRLKYLSKIKYLH